MLSTRKSLRGNSVPPPRSSSPRKSGITGFARRSNGVDVLSLAKELPTLDPEDRENTPVVTPTRSAPQGVRRFSPSPEKAPLREVTTNGPASTKFSKTAQVTKKLPARDAVEPEITVLSDHEEQLQQLHDVQQVTAPTLQPQEEEEDNYVNFGANSDDNDGYMAGIFEHQPDETFDENGDEEMHESIEVDEAEYIPMITAPEPRGSRKRKSDSIEEDDRTVPTTALAKRARSMTSTQTKTKGCKLGDYDLPLDPALASASQPKARPRGRPPAKAKPKGSELSRQQAAQLNQIVEKVRARPGQQKSLYILRRETPADDSAARTRSGRISVKPLAYWRNERCVYGGSPGGVNLAEGARFPLNSIKEIIRTEEVVERRSRSPSKSRRTKSSRKGKGKARATSQTSDSDLDSGIDSDFEDPRSDPHAEEWESSIGIYRGCVSVWDQSQQAPLDEIEDIELAYAPASMQTKEVKAGEGDSRTFRFAKLLSMGFFGSGIVDLAPGGTKRPKNSRKMHMSFFVATGRVTVEVGPWDGEMSRFSVGKGGFWQVPRGTFRSAPSPTAILADLKSLARQSGARLNKQHGH